VKNYSFLPAFDDIVNVERTLSQRKIHPAWADLMTTIAGDEANPSTSVSRGRTSDVRLSTQGDGQSTSTLRIFRVGTPAILIFPLADHRCAIGIHKLIVRDKPDWCCDSWTDLDDDMGTVVSGGTVEEDNSTSGLYDGSDFLVLPTKWSQAIRQALQVAYQTGTPMVWPNDPTTGRTLIEASQEARKNRFARLAHGTTGNEEERKDIGTEIWEIVVGRLLNMALLHQGVPMTAAARQNEITLDSIFTDFLDRSIEQRKQYSRKFCPGRDEILKKIVTDRTPIWQSFVDQNILTGDETKTSCDNRTRRRAL
jgi:hypothetical protein